MKNYVHSGGAVDVVAPVGGLTSGAFCVLGALMGVVAVTAVEGEPLIVNTKGVFTLPKTTSQAWVVGELLYWDVANSRFTDTPGVNRFAAGFAAAPAGSSDTTGQVAIGFGQGLKTVCGQHTTAAAADTVVTGLAKVLSVVASYETDPADANNYVSAQIGDQAGAPAAGSIIIKTWKNTGGSDPTPAAADAFSKLVNWIAVGF